MRRFSSKRNELEAALEEGLQDACRYAPDNECIREAFNALSAFFTPNNAGMRALMMHTAASYAGAIRDREIRDGFIEILRHCTKVPQNECISLTADESRFLSRFRDF